MDVNERETKEKKGSKREQTLVLLDAHAILHRAYHALPDFTAPGGEPTGALYGVVAMLLKIVEELKPDYMVACYDLPEPTHRHVVYEAYKAGRKEADDALVAQIIRSRDIFAAFHIPIYEHPGFEADDILGTIVEQTKDISNLRVIIASGDMDTLQLVDDERVLVYTLKKGIQDTILYDAKKVRERFGFGPEHIPDYKGLRGDPSDNIIGVKGIGEKTGTELIVQFGSIESLYAALNADRARVIDRGIKPRIVDLLIANEEEALFSKMLATIRRDAPIAFALPKVSWMADLDREAIMTLFATLGFRTLATRVDTLLSKTGATREQGETSSVPNEEITKIGLALWLLASDTTNPTLEDIMQYGRAHGVSTFEGARDLILSALKSEHLMHLYHDIEIPLIAVLREMERIGIAIDVPYLTDLSKTMHRELSVLEQRIHEEAGMIFNINSPKQLGEVLYDTLGLRPKNQKRTATGQRSTRESELEKLIDAHPIIRSILRYREVQKLVSTYVDTIPAMVGSDGRLHTTFLQAGSVTGRMASKDPGIQNIPIRTEEGRAIRKAFIAEPGYTLVSIDYSQIELRVAAFLSGDAKLIQIFKQGEDVHQGVASRVFGVPPDAVTPDMRRRAKVINFGILYGMGVHALRANLGEDTTRAEAQEFLNAYFNTFTRLAEYLEEVKAFARTHGYTETYFGRRRHFPGINSSVPFMRAQAERMAINAPVQGTAADIARIAMITIHEWIHAHGHADTVRMLLQVHDELVFEVQSDVCDSVIPELIRGMEEVLPLTKTHGVPIRAEAKTGKNWEEMERF